MIVFVVVVLVSWSLLEHDHSKGGRQSSFGKDCDFIYCVLLPDLGKENPFFSYALLYKVVIKASVMQLTTADITVIFNYGSLLES